MMKIRIKSNTHTHKDEPVKPGTVLDVDDATGRHLVELGAAEAVTKPAAE